ncbi:MAG TPA: IPExxxVDY family protein [Bacteroidales bacterium]|jgi:hypothetical protein|nr:IPExxxVDY family protein [Bacteroidales bacterium]
MMKITKKITRLRLDARQPDEYIVKGLVSAEPDYKISLLINRKFKISLKHADPLAVTTENGEPLLFSRYSSAQPDSEITYTLISNRNDSKNHLLRKFKNVDYIFVVHDPDSMLRQDELSTGLRDLETVTAIFSIDPHSIKDKNIGYLIH